MNGLSIFVFDDEEPHAIRVIDKAGEPWFVAKDVCAVLGVEQATRAVEPLDEDEKGVSSTHTPSGEQEMLTVSEGGLYTLILRSRQATTPGTPAHRFRKWVTGELLPQIRKTGRYAASDDPTADWDWQAIGEKIKLVRETRLALGRKAAEAMWRDLGLPEGLKPEPIIPSGALSGLDFVRQFLAERTAEAPGGRVRARELAQAYAKWAADTGAPSMTERALAMCLDSIGISKSRGNVHHYLGIRIKHLSEFASKIGD